MLERELGKMRGPSLMARQGEAGAEGSKGEALIERGETFTPLRECHPESAGMFAPL